MTGLQWLFTFEVFLWLVGLITISVLLCQRACHLFRFTPLIRYSFSTSLEAGIPPDTITKCSTCPGASPATTNCETITVIPNRQGTGCYWYTGVQRFGKIDVAGVVVAYWLIVWLFAIYNIWAARDTGLLASNIYDWGRFPARWVEFAGYFCLVVLLAALAAGIREFYIILLLMIAKPVQYFLWGSFEYALHQPLRVIHPFYVPEYGVLAFSFVGGLALLVATWYVLIAAFLATDNRFRLQDARVIMGQRFPEPASFALFVSAGVFEALIWLIQLAQFAMRRTPFLIFEWSYDIVFFAAVVTIGVSLCVAALRAVRRVQRCGARGRCSNSKDKQFLRVVLSSSDSDSCASSEEDDDGCDDDRSKRRRHRTKNCSCDQSFPQCVSMFSPLLVRFGFRPYQSSGYHVTSEDDFD